MWVNQGKDGPSIIRTFKSRGVIIPSSTLDSIMARQRKGRIALKHSRPRASKYSREERQQLVDIQNEHTTWTYDQVIAEWRRQWTEQHDGQQCPKHPSHGTLASIFKEFSVTTKNAEAVPAARNTPALIRERAQYCGEALHWDRSRLIFMDETGFDKHVHRRRGRSQRGQPAYFTETTSAGNRLNMCAAVSSEFGLVMHRVLLTSWDTAEFVSFMKALIDHPLLQERSYIFVMDNVAWHHSPPVHDVLLGSRLHHDIQRLPAYSPHLNPIEYVFSMWKARIKATDQLTASQTLQEQIDTASTFITPHLVSRCLDHVYKYYLHCIQEKALEDFDAHEGLGGEDESRSGHRDERDEKEEKRE